MKSLLISSLLFTVATTALADITEKLSAPPKGAEVRAGMSAFTPEGWSVKQGDAQIRWDLGKFYRKGTVEFEIKGPLAHEPKRILFAAWNESPATDGDRKTQAFFQIRLIDNGMMLRLTNRSGGRSFEQATGPLKWADDQWVKVKGTWDTAGGECVLWRDGVEMKRGKFNASFPGFRWVFLGRDNYQPGYVAVAGTMYRNFRLHSLEE